MKQICIILMAFFVMATPIYGAKKKTTKRRKATTTVIKPEITKTPWTININGTVIDYDHISAPAYYRISDAAYENNSFWIDWPNKVNGIDASTLRSALLEWIGVKDKWLGAIEEVKVKTIDRLIVKHTQPSGRAQLLKEEPEYTLNAEIDSIYLKRVTQNLIVFESETYSGSGAIIFHGKTHLNYDIFDERVLSLSDIISFHVYFSNENYDYYGPIKKLLKAKIKEGKFLDLGEFASTETCYEQIENFAPEDFYISENGVVFCYCCGAFGQDTYFEVELTFDELKPYLASSCPSYGIKIKDIAPLTVYYANRDFKSKGTCSDMNLVKGERIADSYEFYDSKPFSTDNSDNDTYILSDCYDCLYKIPKAFVDVNTFKASHLPLEIIGEKATFVDEKGKRARILRTNNNGRSYYNDSEECDNPKGCKERLAQLKGGYVLSVGYFTQPLTINGNVLSLYNSYSPYDEGVKGQAVGFYPYNNNWPKDKSVFDEQGNLLVDLHYSNFDCKSSSIAYIGNLDALYFNGSLYYRQKEMSDEVKELLKAAEAGDAEAQYKLGKRYSVGDGVTRDLNQGYNWSRKAAEQGHARAQNNVGVCFNHGEGVKQDNSQAVYWYRKAAEQGNADAQCNLGYCYYYGNGLAKNPIQAVLWWHKAAEQGNAAAQFLMGLCYYNGDGVAKDYVKAVEWYRKAAEQGNADAQCNLGYCYYYGDGVAKDYSQAVEWYRKAARQGQETSRQNLRNLGETW